MSDFDQVIYERAIIHDGEAYVPESDDAVIATREVNGFAVFIDHPGNKSALLRWFSGMTPEAITDANQARFWIQAIVHSIITFFSYQVTYLFSNSFGCRFRNLDSR